MRVFNAWERVHLKTLRKFNMDTKNGSQIQGNMCHSFNFRRSILKYIEFAGRTHLVGLTSWQIQHVHVMICEQNQDLGECL